MNHFLNVLKKKKKMNKIGQKFKNKHIARNKIVNKLVYYNQMALNVNLAKHFRTLRQ